MGGVIGFTLREEDGIEHRMSRWTNWTPYAIDNIGMVNKSPAHIEEVLREWKRQKDLPKEEKHWAYHWPYLAPSEYGLVVVDLQKNKLLDSNTYHRFGYVSHVCIANELCSTIHDGGGYTMPGSDGAKALLNDKGNSAARLYRFFQEKRIKDFVMWNPETQEEYSLGKDINSFTFDELMEFLSVKDWDNRIRHGRFVLDMSPLEVVTFPESREGWVSFRQAVLDLGLTLTEKEEELWREVIDPKEE